MYWLSLNFHNLPIDIFFLEVSNFDKKKSLFAVVENARLSYCNQRAIDEGLEVGMKLATAYALCNQLTIKQRSFEFEKSILLQLATTVYEFSSQVVIYNEKTILLEVSRSYKLFSDLPTLLKQLFLRLESFQVNVFCALAETPKMSYLLSVYQKMSAAQLTSCHLKMNESAVKEKNHFCLQSIPVEFLAEESNYISGAMIKKMGVGVLNEILSLPAAAVGRRFGLSFLNYLNRLTGAVDDPQPLFSIPHRFSIQRCFIEGLDTIEQMIFPARIMLDELFKFLKSQRMMTTQVVWRLSCFNGDELFFKISLSSEIQNTEQLLNLTRLKLQGFVLNEKIEMIFLESNKFVLLNEQQKEIAFFDAGFLDEEYSCPEEKNEISYLKDKLVARLGSEKCVTLSISNEYLPEFASLICPMEGALTSYEPFQDDPSLSPLWLLDKTSMIHSATNNNQVQLNYKGPLTIISKVERVENKWWDSYHKRDYYIAENKRGVCYWVYHDLVGCQWHVHGVF